MSPAIMIFLRPILSESQPNKTKNGIPSKSALATIMYASRNGTFRIVVIKKRAKNCPVYHTTPWPAVAPNSEIRKRLKFSLTRKASVNGLGYVMPAALIEVKMGDSFIFSRMYSDILTRTIEIRNGMRHPQSEKASLLIQDCVARITI